MVELIRPRIINPNQANGVSSLEAGGIILTNSNSFTTTPGHVVIDTPYVIDDEAHLSGNSLSTIRVRVGWTDVNIINPKYKYSGSSPWTIDLDCVVNFTTDPRNYRSVSTDTTITDGRYLGFTTTNAGAAGTITVTLPAASAARIGWVLRYEVAVAQQFRIDPNGTDSFRGATAGQYQVSSTIGDNVTIECDSATTWKIVSRYGTWSFV